MNLFGLVVLYILAGLAKVANHFDRGPLQSVQSVNRRKMTLSDTGSWLLSFKGGM